MEAVIIYEYYAHITNVHDGDTVRAEVNLGCDVSINLLLRLYGVDAPELKTEAGKQSRDWVWKWLNDNCQVEPHGFLVRITTVKDKKEKYGRYLATIYSTKHETSLNSALIAANQAKFWDGKGSRPV